MKKFSISLPENTEVRDEELNFLLASKLFEAGKITLQQALTMINRRGAQKYKKNIFENGCEERVYVNLKSKSNNILYSDTCNLFTLDFKNNLKASLIPKVEVLNGELLELDIENHYFSVTSNSKFCSVQVKANNDGKEEDIDIFRFRVIRPPKPEVQLIVNGKKYDGTSVINQKSNCLIRLKPDTDFYNGFPFDAQYLIPTIDVCHYHGGRSTEKLMEINSEEADPSEGVRVSMDMLPDSLPEGNLIYFCIPKILRVNFRGEQIEERFKTKDLCVSAYIKTNAYA